MAKVNGVSQALSAPTRDFVLRVDAKGV